MKRILIIFLIGCQLVLLTACKMVVNQEENKHSTDTRKVYGFKLQPENGEAEYLQLLYGDDIPDLEAEHEFFQIHDIHVDVFIKTTEKINYYVNLDKSNCFTLTELFLNDKKEVESGKEEPFCITDKNEFLFQHKEPDLLTEYQIKFIDVDILDGYTIIQYDKDNNKIKEDNIDLSSNKPIQYTISNETVDFLIVEKYIDNKGKVYYKRTLQEPDKEAKQPFYSQALYALTNDNKRIHYSIHLQLEEGIGGDEL